MSDRKRRREHREDRQERKKHKQSEQDDDKYKNQTKKLVYEAQKIEHVETLWVPQNGNMHNIFNSFEMSYKSLLMNRTALAFLFKKVVVLI